jgi:lysophospholipase L1-like esterase
MTTMLAAGSTPFPSPPNRKPQANQNSRLLPSLSALHLILLLATNNSIATAAATDMVGRRHILLLGDSLTQTSFEGWGATLANVYQRRADVVNRGYSGYTTRWYLQTRFMNEPESKLQVELAIVFFGANDASILELNARHHVPLEEYGDNLRKVRI